MRLGKRQRRILAALGLAAGVLMALWAVLPLWFSWVLPPLARRAGVHYARYRAEGYGRFALEGVACTNESLRFSAQRLDAFTPAVWPWYLATGTKVPFLSLNGWSFEPLSDTNTTASIYCDVQDVAADLRLLQRWVPVATFTNGTVLVQGTVVQLPAITWSSGHVWSRLSFAQLREPMTVTADASQAPPYRFQLQSDSLHLQSTLLLATNAAGLSVHGTNLWWNNPSELEASFGVTGQWPTHATLAAPRFQIPAELAGLPGYEAIHGSLQANWQDGQFTLDLSAHARPEEAQTNLPAMNLELRAHGDSHQATIETASLSSPWLHAELSRELVLHYTGPLLREPARCKVAADLNRQPWLPMQGLLEGEADFQPTLTQFPTTHFKVSGSRIGTSAFKADALEVEGVFDWPHLKLADARATFDDGSVASVSATLELKQSLVETGRLSFSGSLPRRYLPPGYSYQQLALSGEFSGPFNDLRHRGHLEVTELACPALRPVQAELDWAGQQQNFNQASLRLSVHQSSLFLQGALALQTNGGTLRLAALTLRKGDRTLLSLDQPTGLSFVYVPASAWRARVEPLHWSGSAGTLDARAAIDWPSLGTVNASVRNLGAESFQDFLPLQTEPVQFQQLDLAAAWTNGPVHLALDLAASLAAQFPLAADVKLTGDEAGLGLQKLQVSSQSTPLLTAEGFLPLTLSPAAPSGLVQFVSSGRLQLRARANPQNVLWEKVAGWTGVRLERPQLNLEVSGTWKEPQGQVSLQAAQIQLTNSTQPLPTLEKMQLELQITPRQARLAQCQLFVQGQPIQLTGELPLDKGDWTRLTKRQFPSLDPARAHVQFAHAKLGAFAAFLPTFLSPEGELSLDLSLLPGFNLEGRLSLQNARTRPMPGVGPVRSVSANLQFQDHQLVLQSASANVGGSYVQLTGAAEFAPTNWLRRSMPPFSFALTGTNVPLTRRPEAIIRADLHLHADKTNGAPPLISGTVNLQNSYFLSDLMALVPGKVATPSQRPPYFSIEDPALADWRLAVKVAGEHFLKVRTTLFNGEVSAHLNLQGSLLNPVALGDLRVDSGLVRFPFGSLNVSEGLVALTSQDPYHPQLSLSAGSKHFGYDLKMQVRGPVDAPVVEFSSAPPLSSEQILLLLTTGDLPAGGATLTAKQRAETLATFLARDFLTKLGFDAGESRLTIQSGEQISETGRPTYSIEFKLSDDWSLVAEYDRFAAYDAGVKWRIYSK